MKKRQQPKQAAATKSQPAKQLSAHPAERPPRARTEHAKLIGAFIRELARKGLGISQGELAKRLGVARSTVCSWENGDYGPGPAKLIELGNLLPSPLCFQAWREAGIDDCKLKHSVAILAPGMRGVPLVELGPTGVASESGRWDLPEATIAPWQKVSCARLSAPLFPFAKGDIVALDPAVIDVWDLCDELVTVHFLRYPALTTLYGWRCEGPSERRPSERINLVEATEYGSGYGYGYERRVRQLVEDFEGASAIERHRAQDTFEEELAKRWTPDQQGTIELSHIQAGWLKVENAGVAHRQLNVAGDANPWRIALFSANGLISVPLTQWQSGRAAERPAIKLQDSKILGRVISWMRSSPQQEQTKNGDR